MTFLDAYPLVAFVADEPAAAEVDGLLRAGGTNVAVVNLCEVIDVCRRVHGVAGAEVRGVIEPLFLVASLAELSRPPFDMPVADSEIIFGAFTEYTGLKFAFYLLAEYGGIVALAAVASVLFLGGYLPLPTMEFIPEPLWMFAKIGALSFLIIWLRATFPRLREDQLQRVSWLVLIPLALVQIMGVAVLKVAV